MKELLKQIVMILRSINEHFVRGNFEDRLKQIEENVHKVQGAEDERWKMVRAMEKYLGIEFDRGVRYIPVNDKKKGKKE